jgi:hypothetical protein
MYICMLHFHLCIIPCLHLCIIDFICIICHRGVLLSYALITIYARFEVMTLLVLLMRCIAMLLIALGYICLWMASFCKNAIWSSLVSRMPLIFKLGAYVYIFLNLCLEPCSFCLGSKTHLSSWIFSIHAILWRSLSFFLPQRHFMYHAWKIFFHVINALNSLSWELNRCMMFTNEKSRI